ncbi:MAG: Uma2 family endonuclease [Pirellulaceae bacterium]
MNAPPLPLPLPTADLPPAAMPSEPVVPLSLAAYHALLRAGVYVSGDQVEFLEGFVVPKMTKGPAHERARRKLRRLLEQLISAEYFVDEQGAVTTGDSEPEPDVFVVRGSVDDFSDRHAGPAEVALVVEVADSSLRRDRTLKQRVYARANVPVYWIVNVADRSVEVLTSPSGPAGDPRYGAQATCAAGDEIPVVIDGRELGRIEVSAIFGDG